MHVFIYNLFHGFSKLREITYTVTCLSDREDNGSPWTLLKLCQPFGAAFPLVINHMGLTSWPSNSAHSKVISS